MISTAKHSANEQATKGDSAMAQVTVQQLAETVGASVERLLAQMKDAGLPHTQAQEPVSDEDKQMLLAFLKRSHGESTAAPRRITLKRKTISTLRTGGSQGKKTVNVEVRKKRTYVKRQAAEDGPGAVTAEQPLPEGAPVAVAGLTPEPALAAGPEAASRLDAEAEFEIEAEDGQDLDPEVLRQRAAARRKQREAAEAAARSAAAAARKAEMERKASAAARPSAYIDSPPSQLLSRQWRSCMRGGSALYIRSWCRQRKPLV